MDFFAIKQLIKKYGPILAFCSLGYYAYDYYWVFEKDPGSNLGLKRAELTSIKAGNQQLEKKVKELEEFSRKLDETRSELKSLAQQLSEAKTVLSEDVQLPDFMKMLVFESKRVGLSILSLTPLPQEKKEYYIGYPIEVRFRGVYAQLYSFLNRLTSLQRIIRVEKVDVKPLSAARAKYVELEGTLHLVTFSYLGSQADQVTKETK